MRVGQPGFTDSEELILTLLALSDEVPGKGSPMLAEVAETLGWTRDRVDVCSLQLEKRGFVERIVTMDGTPWARSVVLLDAAFIWRDRQSPDWPEMKAAASTWLSEAGVGASVDSNSLAQATGLHRGSAAALMCEWEVSGAVQGATAVNPGNVWALTTGLPPT
jgi:hypothetical protein